MKRVIFSALLIVGFAAASEQSVINRVLHSYNIKTNRAFEFNATKSGKGYDITVSSHNPALKEIINTKFMHIDVDEGPIVTTPEFTLAKAGLSAKGSFFDFFAPEAVADINKSLKEKIKYNYEGIVSFGGELKEKFSIAPIDNITDRDVTFSSSGLKVKSTTDLETLKGTTTIELEHLTVNDKSTNGEATLKDLKVENRITEKPIDSILLFGNTSFKVKEFNFKAHNVNKPINAKITLNMGSSIKKVDKEFLNGEFNLELKALDAKTIALLQGVQSSKLNILFKNFGTQGLLEFLKLSKELQEINAKMAAASKSGNDIELQKAIIESTDMANSLVPIVNKLLIKDKSGFKIDWQLHSTKESFVKIDLLYKGEPLSGNNMQSAFISLMAQQLTLVDGNFDIALERSLIVKMNPLSILFLDMLKQKGFISVKDSVYRVKGALKGGKIILKGKAYTIEELTKALF